MVEVELNWTNFELICIKFFEYLFTFQINRISNESSFWKFDSTLLLESNQTNQINFHRIFEYILHFWIHRIANFRIKRFSNEFQFDSTPTTWTNLPLQIFGPDIVSFHCFLPDLLIFNQQSFVDITNVQNLHSEWWRQLILHSNSLLTVFGPPISLPL